MQIEQLSDGVTHDLETNGLFMIILSLLVADMPLAYHILLKIT
jgi:hypothetical protein